MKTAIRLIECATSASSQIHDYALATLIDDRLKQEHTKLPAKHGEAVSMVIDLLRMRLTPGEESGPFSPIFRVADERSILPEDLDSEQVDVLVEIALAISHKTVRARLLDAAFTAGRRVIGRELVQAYNNEIRRIVSGDYDRKFEGIDAPAMDAMPLLIRMVQVDRRITKGQKLSDRSVSTVKSVCELARDQRDFFRYAEALGIAVNNKVYSKSQAASLASELAKSGTADDYPMALKACFELAAACHGEEDQTLRNDALLEAAKCSLVMADQNPQAMAAASWLKTAINEIRQVGGNEQWIASLKARLREVQQQSTSEVGSFSIKLTGLRSLRNRSLAFFREAKLSDAFREVAMHLWPSKISDTKAQIDAISSRTIFDKIVSTSYMDERGRTISHGIDPNRDVGSDEYYKERAIRDLGIDRRFKVFGVLEPARQVLTERFSITEHHFYPLLLNSAFVPRDRFQIFASGLASLWQGNYLVALHLLVPQIENSLRVLLETAGVDHATIATDGTETDKSLSGLIRHFSNELNAILTPEILWEIDVLFNFRPGSAFRHELAHATLPYGAFYGDTARICAWYCYFLVCVFTLKNWDRQVRPMYERAGWS